MVTQTALRETSLARLEYTAPAIDLDSRRVHQEEWWPLIVGVIGLATIAYLWTCDGPSSFSFGWDGVKGNCG